LLKPKEQKRRLADKGENKKTAFFLFDKKHKKSAKKEREKMTKQLLQFLPTKLRYFQFELTDKKIQKKPKEQK